MNDPSPLGLISAFKTAPNLDPQTLAAATSSAGTSQADAVGSTQATAAFATTVQAVNNVSKLNPTLQAHVWNSQNASTQAMWKQAGYQPPDINHPNNSPGLLGTMMHDIGGAASAVGHGISTVAGGAMGVLGAPLRFVQHIERATWVQSEQSLLESGMSPDQVHAAMNGGALDGAAWNTNQLSNIFNLHDWATSWRETSNGEKSFDPMVVRHLAEHADPLKLSLARQMASVPTGTDPGPTESAIVNMYPQAQRQNIVQMLRSDPEIKTMVQQLQDAKLSLGREIIGSSTLDTHPGLHKLAGLIDAGFDLTLDPTLQAGKVAKAAEIAKWGLDSSRLARLAGGDATSFPAMVRALASGPNADRSVVRQFQTIADIANAHGWGAVGRVMKVQDPMTEALTLAHKGTDAATAESVANVYADVHGIQSIVTGETAKVVDGVPIFPHLSVLGQAKVMANLKFQKGIDFLAEAGKFGPDTEKELGVERGGTEEERGTGFAPHTPPLSPDEQQKITNLVTADDRGAAGIVKHTGVEGFSPDPAFTRTYLAIREKEVADAKSLTAEEMAFLHQDPDVVEELVQEGYKSKPMSFPDIHGHMVQFAPDEGGPLLTQQDIAGDVPQQLADEVTGRLRKRAAVDMNPLHGAMRKLLVNRATGGLARTFKQITTLTQQGGFIDFTDPNSVTQVRRMLQPFLPTWAVDSITDAYLKAGRTAEDGTLDTHMTSAMRFQVFKGAVAQIMHFAGINSISDGHTVSKNILDAMEASMHGETYAPLGLDKMADGLRDIRGAVLDSQTNTRAWMPSFKELHAAILQDAFLHSVRVPLMNAEERFMNAWRAGVLFRPGFPIRVSVDENLGNMLRNGVIQNLQGHWAAHLARSLAKDAKELTPEEAVAKIKEAESTLDPADVGTFRGLMAMLTDTPKELVGNIKDTGDVASAYMGEKVWKVLDKLPFGSSLSRADVHLSARLWETYIHPFVASTISAIHNQSGGGMDTGQEVMKWINQNGKSEFFRFKLGRTYNNVDLADDFYRQKWYHTLGTIARSKIGQEVLRGLTEDIGPNALRDRIIKFINTPEFAKEKALMLRAHQNAEGATVASGAITQLQADRQLANKAIRTVQLHVTSGEVPMRMEKGVTMPNWRAFEKTRQQNQIRGLIETMRDGELNPDVLRDIPHHMLPQHIIGPDIIPVSPVDNWLEKGFQGLGHMMDTLSRQPIMQAAFAKAIGEIRPLINRLLPDLQDLSLRENEILINRVHATEHEIEAARKEEAGGKAWIYKGLFSEDPNRNGGLHFSPGHEPNQDVMQLLGAEDRAQASHYAGKVDEGTLRLAKGEGKISHSNVGASAALEHFDTETDNLIHSWEKEEDEAKKAVIWERTKIEAEAGSHAELQRMEEHLWETEAKVEKLRRDLLDSKGIKDYGQPNAQAMREILGADAARKAGYHSILFKSGTGMGDEYVALKDEAIRHLRTFENPERDLNGFRKSSIYNMATQEGLVDQHTMENAQEQVDTALEHIENMTSAWMEEHGYDPRTEPTLLEGADLEKFENWQFQEEAKFRIHDVIPYGTWEEEAAKLRAPTEAEIAAHEAAKEELLSHLAVRRAMTQVKPYIHSPEVRSQFEVMHRTAMPFLFAQDQFLKRWGKTFLTDPTTIAKAQLGMNGLRTSGVIHTDANGNDVFYYPGSAYVTDFLARTAQAVGIPASVPLSIPFTGQVKYLMPGLSNPLTPSVGPTVAIPLKQMTSWFPEFNGVEQGLLGPGASTTYWQQIMPTTISRLYTAVTGDPNSQGEFSSAMMKAMQDLQAQGHGLPSDATTAQKETYIRRLTDWTRILFFTKAVLGFAAPASPSEKFDPSNLNLRLQTLMSELPYDKAISQFLKEQPDATPYTVFASKSDGGANLPASQAAGQFINSNSTFIQNYPQAAGWFIPRTTGSGKFDPAVYREQIQYGMRTEKLPSQFLNDVLTAPAGKTYYAAYDKEQADLKAAGNNTQAKQQIRATFDQEKVAFMAQNPTFADSLTASTTKSRRESTIQELQQALVDPMLPKGPQTDHIREMMTAYDAYMQDYDSFVGQSSTQATQAKRSIQEQFLQEGIAYAAANPDVSDLWTNLIKPEVTDTTSGVAATPAASTLLGQVPVAPPATPTFAPPPLTKVG